MLSKTNLPAK